MVCDNRNNNNNKKISATPVSSLKYFSLFFHFSQQLPLRLKTIFPAGECRLIFAQTEPPLFNINLYAGVNLPKVFTADNSKNSSAI